MESKRLTRDIVRECLDKASRESTERGCDAAVLVPLMATDEGIDVLFEVRALMLKHQPGEVCLPGGMLEPGETAWKAALRETCEELLVEPAQVEYLGDLGLVSGLGDFRVRAFVGVLSGYQGTFDPSEVDTVHTVPLAWFEEHEPAVYRSTLESRMPDDFPWDLIPGGREYPFRKQTHNTYFYHGTEPLIWGFTAHVMARLVKDLRTR